MIGASKSHPAVLMAVDFLAHPIGKGMFCIFIGLCSMSSLDPYGQPWRCGFGSIGLCNRPYAYGHPYGYRNDVKVELVCCDLARFISSVAVGLFHICGGCFARRKKNAMASRHVELHSV